MQLHGDMLALRKCLSNSVSRIYASSDLLSNAHMIDIDEIRRENLRRLEMELSGPTKAAAKLGMSYSQFANLRDGARDSKTGKPRGMRKQTARRIEKCAGKPEGWLDALHDELLPSANGAGGLPEQESPDNNTGVNVKSNVVLLRQQHEESPDDGYVRMDLLSPTPSAGRGAVVSEAPYVVRHLDVLESWARTTLGCADPRRVKLLTCVGDSMESTIKDRDVVFVDLAQNRFSHPGIYVLSINDALLIKRLDMTVTGDLEVISDNRDKYAPQRVHAAELDQVNIAGRVVGWWTLKTS